MKALIPLNNRLNSLYLILYLKEVRR